MPASGPHLDIGHWLTILDLSQYSHLFDTYSGVEHLLNFSEAHIKELGVKNSAHRARMVTSLVALRNKYDKGARKAEKASQRHSVAVDPSRLDNKVTESDLLVVSNVTQSKSLCNIRMEASGDGGEPAALRKALEWELSLETRDLRSHAWYHGAIPRGRAEEIVREPGQFLVRDCTSQPGNYVLTCRTAPLALHFVINKVVIQPDTVYERVQYQFEDDPFDTVPDLITYYVGNCKPVTAHSRARITTPCNRMYPLSFYATKYGGLGSQRGSPLPSPMTASRPGSQNSGHSPSQSPPRNKRDLPPRLPSKKKSLPETNGKGRADERSTSADGVIADRMSRSMGAEGSRPHNDFHSLPRRNGACLKTSLGASTMPRNVKVSRGTSDPGLSPSMERKPFPGEEEGPPPKPGIRPLLLEDHYNAFHNKVSTYHASGSDSGNGSGDSAQSSDVGDVPPPPPRPGGVIIKTPGYGIPPSSSSTTLKASEYDSALEDSRPYSSLPLHLPSAFDLENFQTLLLPTLENKPLDSTALEGVKMRLRDTGSRILANHLTRVDLELTTGSERICSWDDFSVVVTSGVELCRLPFGHQMRLDLIERTVCLNLLVAVTILTCPGEAERAETLNKWIQVAIDTKTALGNLFGFNAIMLGLCMPQIQRLTTTWHILRQKFTDSAFNFEAKLRPTLKSMNECTNPLAPNTTIPHLLPYLLIQERDWNKMLDPSSCNQLSESCYLASWESATRDMNLGTLWSHVDAARKYTESVPTFRRNSEIVLGDSKVDDLLLEMFRTEFHLKFLWGSRGAGFHASERYVKFDKVVTAMSANCEPPSEPPIPPQPSPPSYNPAIGTSV